MKRNSEHIVAEWLVLGAQLGDASALHRLVTLLYPRLLRFATRQLNDEEAARDVVQSTLEVLSKDIRRVRDPAAFTKWIYRIAYRKGVDTVRQNQRLRSLSEQAVNPGVVETREPAFIQLDKLLQQLDGDSYQVVHLHYLEGLNLNEIAEVLTLPLGTVKSRLYKARQSLKRSIAGDENE